ncbi:hypothetical protein Bbelb_179950 [Branchiostoma belcheri]|nr:hypothetical protein Bbelb_179950 [Branchiostoma belcheri]
MFAVSRHAFRRLSAVELSPCARVVKAMKTEHSSSSLGVKLLCLLSVFQADPHRGRRAGSGWDACSELSDDLVTLKVRLDHASPPGAALVRQLKTTAVGDLSLYLRGDTCKVPFPRAQRRCACSDMPLCSDPESNPGLFVERRTLCPLRHATPHPLVSHITTKPLPLLVSGTGAQVATVESILVADLTNKAIYKVNATTGSKETLPLGPLPNPVAVDYDATSGYLYWTDSQAHQVQRAYLNGTGMEVIASTSTMVPDGVALDIPGGNVYWTDTSRDAISVARMDGRFTRNVLTTGLDQPRAIALDPANGYMYWTDWGAQAKIERAAMDGTGRTALVTTGLLWPNGLTIDQSAQRLYWCDARTYKIESSDLNGYDRRDFYWHFGAHFFGIAVDPTHVYWTAWNADSIVKSLKTTAAHETIGSGFNRTGGIHLMKSGTYQPVSNACTSQNGGCQHLCLARPGGRTCACRSSWRIQDDGVTCQPLVIVPPSVVWTRRDQVTGINIVEMLPGNSTTIREGLGSGGSLTVKNLFSVNPPSFLTALDFDIRRQQMFWTDSGLQAIHKIDFLNEASVATILKGTSSSVQGLAVDWLNQNLYYTDAFYNWIGLFNTNSSNHHVVVQTGLDRPQGIAVHPSRGQIFWSDRGREPKIESATLSGQNRTVLVSNNIQAPHGMVIDYVRNRLYWADSGLDIIGSYDLDDGTQGIYRYSPGTHFFDIAFDGVGILATDQSGNDLHVIVDGEDVIEAQLRAQPHGVAFYHENRQQWQQTDCQVNNGGCQHTCVGDAGGHRCLCLLGYSLGDDNHTCTEDGGLPSVALLFSSDAGVYWLRHDLPDVPSDVSVSLGTLVSGLRVVAMDVNYAGKMLFYTQDVADGTQRIYRRSLIHGSIDASHFIYAGGSNIEGIAVDWVASNLYWTEKSHGQIQVTRLDGGFRKVIVSGLDQPLGVAVHPREGFLFWTESGTTPRVARATLAGTETRTLVSGFSVNQPRGLAIDFLEDRIYWVDGFHGTVQSCDVNGGNVVSHSITGAFDLSGITIYKDYVLMTDSDNRRLVIGLRQHDGSFGVHRTVSGLGTEPHNIRMYDGNEQLSHPGPCDEDNGGCGDLCLPVPSGRVCACGEGRFLQLDGHNCGLNVPSLSFDLSADGRAFINLTLAATDGEGTALQVEGSVSLPGYVDYEPERQHWSFRAVDRWGRTATCSFDVTILDSHSPTIHNCPGNITMETATDGVTVTWDAPTAVDNSGRDVTLTASKDPGSRFYFADPQNMVTYTARDMSGNTATCDFWIILKSASSTCSESDLPPVTNGFFGTCSVSNGVKSCPVICNDSNNRLTPSTRVIRCQPDGRWEIGGRSPLSVSSSASFSITTAPCHDDAGFLHAVTSNMVDHFGQTGVCWSANRNSVPLCESGNDGTFPHIRLSCRQNNARKRRDLEENSRGRRDLAANSRGRRDLTDAILFTSRESVIHLTSDNLSNRALRDVGTPSLKNSKATEHSVENIVVTNPAGKSQSRRVKREEGGIDVLLEMKINMAAGDVGSAEERLQNVIDDVRTRVTTGDVVVRVNDVTYTADADSFSSTEITVDCPKDTEKKGNLCVFVHGTIPHTYMGPKVETAKSASYSGLSKTTTIGIGAGAAACLLIICTIVIVWCRGNRYKLQRPTRRNSQLNTFHNPAFADPIYDVIKDKPMAPPVVSIPLDGRRVAGNEYAENPGPLGDDGGYEIPPAARAPPTTFMPNYSQERGRLQNDADVDHDYSYPNKESGPYQALGGTFQRHHEYQTLAGIGQRRQHPGNENDGRGANQQRQTNVVPMATGPVNNNSDHGQAVTFNWGR